MSLFACVALSVLNWFVLATDIIILPTSYTQVNCADCSKTICEIDGKTGVCYHPMETHERDLNTSETFSKVKFVGDSNAKNESLDGTAVSASWEGFTEDASCGTITTEYVTLHEKHATLQEKIANVTAYTAAVTGVASKMVEAERAEIARLQKAIRDVIAEYKVTLEAMHVGVVETEGRSRVIAAAATGVEKITEMMTKKQGELEARDNLELNNLMSMTRAADESMQRADYGEDSLLKMRHNLDALAQRNMKSIERDVTAAATDAPKVK